MEIFFLPKKYGICHCVWWAWNCNRHDKRPISNSAYIYSLIYVHVLETICVHVVITSVCSSSVSFSSRFSSVYWHVWMNTAIKHNFHKSLINRQKKGFWHSFTAMPHTVIQLHTQSCIYYLCVRRLAFFRWIQFFIVHLQHKQTDTLTDSTQNQSHCF